MRTEISPQFESAALVTIDTQQDVLDGGAFPVAGTTAVLPAMRRVLEAFRNAGRTIIHIVRLYEQDGSNAEPCRRELLAQGAAILIRGSSGAELAREIVPPGAPGLDAQALLAGRAQALAPNEIAIYKPRWGAFYRTPLEQQLRERGVTTLVFAGCNFPNCPRTSIYEASERDFRVVAVRDAISGLYERGEQELRGIGVALMGAEEVVEAVRTGPPGPTDAAKRPIIDAAR